MKINVSHIPAEGMKLQLSRDAKWLSDLCPPQEKIDFIFHGADISCFLRKISETVYVEGNTITTVDLECCRCLDVTTHILRTDFKYTFAPSENHAAEEMELSVEDLEVSYYDNDIIDLDQMIFEQIALQIPMKALCADSCKGLCPHCGINLNSAKCTCNSEFVDERLAVLKKLKVKH
ncbi:MAG: DUF177 domain-containing protein [Deltaproteobacteria bacterium]|nr:DUF177 domain-containing protein [Deltaproteobacteria bacterium]